MITSFLLIWKHFCQLSQINSTSLLWFGSSGCYSQRSRHIPWQRLILFIPPAENRLASGTWGVVKRKTRIGDQMSVTKIPDKKPQTREQRLTNTICLYFNFLILIFFITFFYFSTHSHSCVLLDTTNNFLDDVIALLAWRHLKPRDKPVLGTIPPSPTQDFARKLSATRTTGTHTPTVFGMIGLCTSVVKGYGCI